MTSFRYSANIKVGLLLIGFLFFTGILYYSQWIVERLREDNRKIVHMYAEIIASGTELLMGETQDTNSSYLASQLPSLGLEVPAYSLPLLKGPHRKIARAIYTGKYGIFDPQIRQNK